MIPKFPLSSVIILNTKTSGQTLCSHVETDTPKHPCFLSSPTHAAFSPWGPFCARSIHYVFLGNGALVTKEERNNREGRGKVSARGRMGTV